MNVRIVRRRSWAAVFAVALLATVFVATPAGGGLNNDGNVDIVFASDPGLVCTGDGLGGFTCSTTSGIIADADDVKMGFFDADTNLDAILAGFNVSFENQVCLGDGSAGFTCSDVGSALDGTPALDVGFINGDANLDVIFVNRVFFPFTDPSGEVCLGDGLGGFTCSTFVAADSLVFDVALGQVDGDGFLDAMFGGPSGASLCSGDGTGSFTCQAVAPVPAVAIHATEVELGFMDGDSNLDAVFASSLATISSSVCLGDGSNGFTCSPVDPTPPGPFGTRRVATGVTLGFVNADDNMDVVFSNIVEEFLGGEENRVCLGDGTGVTFTCSDLSTSLYDTADVDGGYINDDPFLDVAFSGRNDPNEVCLGVGDGSFTCSDIGPASGNSIGVGLTPSTRPAAGPTVYVSSTSGGSVGGVTFADEDIIVNNPDGSWEMHFDASDVNLAGVDIDAFAVLDDGDDQTLDPILFSMRAPLSLPGGLVIDDSDIVEFAPTSLGDTTAGTFARFFDGSDVGLTTNAEDVDAIGFDDTGRLVISTAGRFSVPRTGGGSGNGRDEDLIVFNDVSFGPVTSGDFEPYFDGSDVSLGAGREDVWGVSIDSGTGDIYLTTRGNYNVPGLSGDLDDIVRFEPTTNPPGAMTAGTFSLFWDGDLVSYGGERIDGLTVVLP